MRTGSGYLHREAFRPLLRLVTVGRRRGAGLSDCSPRCAVSWSTWPATTIVRRAQLWVLDLPIAGAAELGVTGAQMEHMPFYLRAFLRVLSSWVHSDQDMRGGVSADAGNPIRAKRRRPHRRGVEAGEHVEALARSVLADGGYWH